jgi:hypothetical protein
MLALDSPRFQLSRSFERKLGFILATLKMQKRGRKHDAITLLIIIYNVCSEYVEKMLKRRTPKAALTFSDRQAEKKAKMNIFRDQV